MQSREHPQPIESSGIMVLPKVQSQFLRLPLTLSHGLAKGLKPSTDCVSDNCFYAGKPGGTSPDVFQYRVDDGRIVE